ncbi:ADC synthase [Chaetomidium leptoderma]|uniref:aminodeoxychorismate synthase n=1 Tax=Chaetomidium leptoderma TaxID=669021 RepID=A0AAN6ZX29_9PEZI|nr:ADC synthase [Chaetomidium leptoderma]
MGSLPRGPGERPSILYVDAFDSFANNITGLLEQRLGAQVTLVHIDDSRVDKNLDQLLSAVDAVVVGPGPGHPANPRDVGFINKLWALNDAHVLPVLGICLGFQSLCLNHGAEVKRLQSPRHGIVTKASHGGADMFAGLGELEATQYHSLHADIGRAADGDAVCWEPTDQCPSLRPLAWDVDDETNGPILMAVRHTTKPFWGVQFHPESICTSEAGAELIGNWWTRAREWLLQRGRSRADVPLSKWLPPSSSPWAATTDQENPPKALEASHLAQELRSIAGPDDVFLRWARYPAAGITPTALLDALGYSGEEVIVLDSQGHETGRFDILGLVVPGQTMKVTYKVSDRTLRYGAFSTRLGSIDKVWPMLQEALDLHVPRNLNPEAQAGSESPKRGAMDRFVAGHLPEDTPFWGGFMGYISYEAGLETIDVAPHTTGSAPDLNFAFIHRSIVIDRATSHVYVQSLLPNDWNWILSVGSTVDSMVASQQPPLPSPLLDTLTPILTHATTTRPTGTTYRAKVNQCQTHLCAGDSYELCLTDSSTITLPTISPPKSATFPWRWYQHLRLHNPAPHGAYLHLSSTHVVSSSPERFLQWTREGVCEFRPIKGTVQKRGLVGGRVEAERILGSAKERAENLMIVDLIRHDLGGVVGAGNVWVSQLMEVEEFERVWHLVSVVAGRLRKGPGVTAGTTGTGTVKGPRGTDVLRRSLPPGSMTGAPKKRSCEILKEIEGRPRGVYSGVLGYMDVGGGGDFSVVIRTAVREREGDVEVWRVGAGGAVTVQSTEEGEFLEMETKASSVLDALFKGVAPS